MLRRFLSILFLLASASAHAASPPSSMVVAAHPQAAKAGIEILEKGGNAFDAAAATALTLGVVEPGSSGIGGGGFFLLYIAKSKQYVFIDARETSPRKARHGEVYREHSSIDGPAAAGVPGLIAGVDKLVTKYGRFKRADIAAPAIELARNGFAVSPRLNAMIQWRKKAFNDAARRTFEKGIGETIVQPALAETLKRYANHGAKEFYRGETAGRLIGDIMQAGGLIDFKDLAAYHAIERKPVQFSYQGYKFVTAALPSSGGMVLAEILGMLKNDDLKTLNDADRAHLLIEAMKRAYKDRNEQLGDPAYVRIPNLLKTSRLKKLRNSIDMQRATPSNELGKASTGGGAGMDTTHFSIIDTEGNMVAATLSINYGFGSGFLSASTGILLNDEMDDFATQPGKPNAYGLVQGKANAVAPGKRMLSSMTPTFVIGPDRTFIVGTPGGSRIISMVLLASVGFMLNEAPPAEWGGHARFHHQYQPDIVQFEMGAFSPEVSAELSRRGHMLKPNGHYGNMQAILWNRKSDALTGLPDLRGEGTALQTTKESNHAQ